MIAPPPMAMNGTRRRRSTARRRSGARAARQSRTGWLEVSAIAVLCAGAVGYGAIIARFDGRDVFCGAGDQWIAGGAAAITALACATLAGDSDSDVLDVARVIAWVAAMLWLPFLVAGELRQPRPGTLGRRWSTVFPLGIYAAMSFAITVTVDLPAAHAFALAWTAVTTVVWAVVATAAARRAVSRRRFVARLTRAWRGR
jgi:tellurite resistance protein TehA-like permease